MKICIIGNSHIAALKLGWDHVSKDYHGVDIRFYGSGGQSLKNIRLEERLIVPISKEVESNFQITSGFNSTINIDEYDRVVIVGSGLALHWIVDVYAECRAEHHVRNNEYMVSSRLFNAASEK